MESEQEQGARALGMASGSVLRGLPSGTDGTSIEALGLNAYYGPKQVLREVSMGIRGGCVTAIIGPSGCGKSTFIRCLNRMHELGAGARVTGRVALDGQDIYAPTVDPALLRRRVGMVFQEPNPFRR